jgi:hypothetical protein
MMGLTRRMGAAVAVFIFWAAGPAAAQENLDKGKSAAQLYASDCAICHKSPRGLAKGAGRYGLDNFLRAHYTASRESAAAISAYLRAIDSQPATKRERNSKRKTKAAEPKLPPSKPMGDKSSNTKPSEANPAEKTIPSAGKGEDAESSSAKASEAKPPEHAPAVSQPAEAKAEPPKVSPPKPADKSHDPKPDKSD